MTMKSKMRALLAGALVCAAGTVAVQADTLITFSVDMTTNNVLGTFTPGTDTVAAYGTFTGNNFGTGFQLVQDSSQLPELIYTNTYDDTAELNGTNTQYKFVINGSTWENLPTGQNRMALLPVTSGASLVLPTAFFADAGAPVVSIVTFAVDVSQQANLGNYVPGTSSVVVAGLFNGWNTTNTPLVQSGLPGLDPSEPAGSVWTNSIMVTNSPGGMEAFKFVINDPTTVWDSPSPVNSDGGGNRYFASVSQTLPTVNFSDAPYFPIFCTNTFSVDMSGPAQFDPSYDPTTVTLWGSFNGWAGGIVMTNNINGSNTNLFTTSQPVFYTQGGTVQYQFRYTDSGGTVYDHAPNGQNRVLVEPSQYFYAVPSVFFNNVDPVDYLAQPIDVTFTIDMTGAVGTDNTVWAPGAGVFINGPWPNWQNWDPLSLDQLTEVGSTPIYTGTFTIPAGLSSTLTYKYSLGGTDNEAGQDQNLIRVIRATSTGAYSFPQDKWQNQYQEPSFGQLAVKPAAGGNVALSWLGRQGCQVQTATSLASPSWVSLPLTDGTNWTVGTVSTNGLVSATNYPAGTGTLFFRLIKK